MNAMLKEQIVEKLKEIPDTKLPEIMDFLEFLVWKARHQPSASFDDSVHNPLNAFYDQGKREDLLEFNQLEQGENEQARLRPYGQAAGQFIVPDDFDDPLPERILAGFEGDADLT